MHEKCYCPDCGREVEVVAACGATNYFCNYCKKLISSKKVIKKTKNDL